jgi:BNR-Asp box repeat
MPFCQQVVVLSRALVNLMFASAFALACVVLPARVHAHSLPYGVALSWADTSSSALPVIVTNRGLVFATGQSTALSFSVRCNEAIGTNTSDRPLAYLEANGNLTVGIYNRVFQTSDQGCTLKTSAGLPELPISSLLSSASAPQRMYVGTRAVDQRAGIFASEDYGRTFSQVFTNKTDEYYETIVLAPSDSLRLYALGLHFDRVNLKVIFYASVSLDGGKNWEDTVTDAKITPLAVHPTKPDVVFAYRATDKYETNFDILRSDDRGKNFKVVLPGVYLPTGFTAVGNTLYLGMSFHGGLYQSHDDGLSFQQLLPEQIQRITCLAEHAGKLWLCANISPNLDAIWTLKADASGVDKVMSFDAVTAPVACSDATASELCTMPWHDFDIEVHPPPDDAGVDAGMPTDASLPDAGLAEEDAGSEELPGEPVSADGGAEPEQEDGAAGPKAKPHSRCQFGVSAPRGCSPWGPLLLAVLALSYRRRRRA